MRVRGNNLYKTLLSFLFFFFFMSPALSPAVGGNTIYLFWFIPFLDSSFLARFLGNNLLRQKKKTVLASSVICGVLIVFFKFFILIKLAFFVVSYLYLDFLYKNNRFNCFYHGININIILAALQQILFGINPEWSFLIGPTSVSKAIWGKYATLTFTNFYPIFSWGMIRTCGWSREAGFFSALLNLCIIYYIYGERKKSFLQSFLFFVGYMCSFSKMSLLVFPMILVIRLKKYINKVPIAVTIAAWVVLLTAASIFLQRIGYYTFENESILHRLIGYLVVINLPFKELALGFKSISDLPDSLYLTIPGLSILKGRYELCGIPNMVQEIGILGTLLLATLVNCLGLCSTGILIWFLGTFDVTLFTSTSFVVLAFWIGTNKQIVK